MTEAPHISEIVIATLEVEGWTARDPHTFKKLIEGFAPAGTVSNGARVVTLQFCPAFRYFSRLDGWEKVEKDVDLREYERTTDGVQRAIADVLK